MKPFFNLLFITALLLSVSCSNENEYNCLSDLQVDVPQELKGNADIVNFINDNTLMLNNWSRTFEKFVVECKPYIARKNEELTFEEREKLGKTMMEFVAGMGKFSVDVAKMQQDATFLKCELSDNEIILFNHVQETFNLRAKTINEKYFNFGKEL
jgi:hypothetical protein